MVLSWQQNWYKPGLRVLPSVKSGEVTAGSGNKAQPSQTLQSLEPMQLLTEPLQMLAAALSSSRKDGPFLLQSGTQNL